MKRILVIALALVVVGSLPVQAQTTATIENLLKNKSAHDKANIKATEITKLNFVGTYDDIKTGIRVEIRSLTKIENGIELYARAWKDGKQLGFVNGSVEWERFIFINPPILVDDPNGAIIRTWTEKGISKERKLREDPIEAIRQSLAHTIKVSAKRGINIVKGSIGHTTLTTYPAAGANSPVDGYANGGDANIAQSWSTVRDGAGTGAGVTDIIREYIYINGNADGTFYTMRRGIFLFDTSIIGLGSTISTATMSLWGTNKRDTASIAVNIDVYTSNPVSTSDLQASDYAQLGSTSQTGSPISYSSWNISGYNDFTFNATGRGNISLTGISKFGVRNASYDAANIAPTISGTDVVGALEGYLADDNGAGTSRDPKLVVVYGPPPAPPESNLWQKRAFEGQGFITTTNEITITPAAETNFVLIRNPTASGKLHRSNNLVLTVRTEGQNVRVRIYKNPTVTADGTPILVNNVRTSGNPPVSQVFTLPTTSSPGELMAAYSRNADSLDRSLDLSLYLEQGESYLITVQGTAPGNDYILTYTFVEE